MITRYYNFIIDIKDKKIIQQVSKLFNVKPTFEKEISKWKGHCGYIVSFKDKTNMNPDEYCRKAIELGIDGLFYPTYGLKEL